MNARSFSMSLLLLALAIGCGSYPPPAERLTTAEAAIRGAEEVGATRVPRAALHLKLAEEQTDKARRLMEEDYNERAELTLKRAQADAELAIAIAKEHEAFLDRHARVLRAWERRADTDPEEAYRDYLLALDSWRQQPGTPAYCQDLDAAGLEAALAKADVARIPEYRAQADEAARPYF